MHTAEEQRRLYTLSGDLSTLTKEMDRFNPGKRLRPFKYRRNPLPALALAAISGLGIGAGATAGGILVTELTKHKNPASIEEITERGLIMNPSKKEQNQMTLVWAIGALVVLFFSKDMLPK